MWERDESDKDKILRSMEINSNPEDFDMTSSIMQKVRGIHQRNSRNHPVKRRRKVLIASLSALLILSSMTVYASTHWIQIKNKEGKIILETRPQQSSSRSESYGNRLDEYKAELKKNLKPGESAIFYLKDEQMNEADQYNLLHYYYEPVVSSTYDDLTKEIQRLKAPMIHNLDGFVPDGYIFESGLIQVTSEPAPHTPEYELVLKELKDRAAESNDDQALFYKMVPPSKAVSTVVKYHKGDRQLKIIAFVRTPGSPAQVLTDSAEKLSVKGTELILSSDPAQQYLNRRLTWLNHDETVLFTITDDPKEPLTNNEFVKIAEGLIRD